MASAVIAVIAGGVGAAAASSTVLALGLTGTIAGTLVGAAVGAVVGGAISAAGAAIMGEDVGDAFLSGALTGAIGGGLAGYNAAVTNATSPQADWNGINAELDANAATSLGVDGQPLSGDVFEAGAESVFGTESLAGAETGTDVITTGGKDGGLVGETAAEKSADKIAGTGDAAESAAKTVAETAEKAPTESKGLLSKVGEWWNSQGDFTKGSIMQSGGGMLSDYAKTRAASEESEEEEEEEEARIARLNTSIDATPYSGYSFSSSYTS